MEQIAALIFIVIGGAFVLGAGLLAVLFVGGFVFKAVNWLRGREWG